MKKRNRALASATVLSLVLTSTVTAGNVQAAAEVTRVPGANREATAIEVAEQVFATAETVVLVNGYGYADAVSATPLAKALGAPILLTNKVDAPTAELKASLEKLGAKKIVIVGGEGAVTPAMETALKANYTVERFGGASRYETNANVAKKVLELTGKKAAVLVNGQDGYADALSVASIAAVKGMPVLFGNKNEVPAAVKTVAEGLDVIAVGGTAVLPEAVLKAVDATRVAQGANRFETNLAVLDHFKGDLKLENIYVAAGGNDNLKMFSDALVASAAAAKAQAPVVLTGLGAKADDIDAANDYIAKNMTEDTKVTVIGGTASVSTAIVNELQAKADEINGVELGEVKTVSLDEKVYDDDTKEQQLTFKVNGRAASVEELRQKDYSVNFVAVDEDEVKANIFAPTSAPTNISTTGLLADEVKADDYTVEIQVIKDGRVVVSDKKVITVKDVESTATAINEVELTNVVNGAATGFVYESTTLVVGEAAQITDITGNVAGKTDVSLSKEVAKATTSNSSIVSVNKNSSTNEITLTANAPGTATVTVEVGSVKKTINLTVKSDARKVAKVTPSQTTVKVVKGQTRLIDVEAKDQYGDPIAIDDVTDNTRVKEDLPKDSAGINLVTVGDVKTSSVNGNLFTTANPTFDGETEEGFAIKGDKKGTGTILFKDDDNKVVGQISIQITEVDNVKYEKVEFAVKDLDESNDEFEIGDKVQYIVAQYNTEDAFNGVVDLGVKNYTVAAADGKIAKASIVTTASGEVGIEVEALKEGKTDVFVKDANGLVKHKFTVTVEKDDTAITKVNFKEAKSINYSGEIINVKDILDVRADGTNDAIVYGVEHNVDTAAKVRIKQSTANQLVLYVDNGTTTGSLDSDGTDEVLGVVTAEVLSGSTTATSGTPMTISDITTTEAGNYKTVSKDKGTILFRVIEDDNNDGTYAKSETIATTTITIDVK